MRFLDGRELVGFIKTRQIKTLETLNRATGIVPKLTIIITLEDRVIDTYVKLKEKYGDEIGASITVYRIKQAEVPALLDKLNKDNSVHGIIIQLPLAEPNETDKLCRLISPQKDVDGLNPASNYDSATATAINWLLAGYGIDLHEKELVIVGQGKLVGKPLLKIWQQSKLRVAAMTESDLSFEKIKQANIIITAAGKPELIKAEHLAKDAVVVDAGTTSVDGNLIGDVDPNVYKTRDDLTITPLKGGVGPVTIAVLFEHLIIAGTATSLSN